MEKLISLIFVIIILVIWLIGNIMFINYLPHKLFGLNWAKTIKALQNYEKIAEEYEKKEKMDYSPYLGQILKDVKKYSNLGKLKWVKLPKKIKQKLFFDIYFHAKINTCQILKEMGIKGKYQYLKNPFYCKVDNTTYILVPYPLSGIQEKGKWIYLDYVKDYEEDPDPKLAKIVKVKKIYYICKLENNTYKVIQNFEILNNFVIDKKDNIAYEITKCKKIEKEY